MKPANFTMGLGSAADIVYIIDFGLAKRYIDPKTSQHIPYRNHIPLAGTVRYVSLNVHMGCEQSRRDDIESLMYVLLQFMRGHLPWQGLKVRNKREKQEKVMEIKRVIDIDDLCAGCPSNFPIA